MKNKLYMLDDVISSSLLENLHPFQIVAQQNVIGTTFFIRSIVLYSFALFVCKLVDELLLHIIVSSRMQDRSNIKVVPLICSLLDHWNTIFYHALNFTDKFCRT